MPLVREKADFYLFIAKTTDRVEVLCRSRGTAGDSWASRSEKEKDCLHPTARLLLRLLKHNLFLLVVQPPKAPAPGSEALDLRLDTKSEPGQMMRKEWKTARIKGSFSPSDAGCNASPGTRPTPLPTQDGESHQRLLHTRQEQVGPGRAVGSLPGCQHTALQHRALQNATQNTEKNLGSQLKRTQQQRRSHGLMVSTGLMVSKTIPYTFLEGKGNEGS